MSVVSQLTKRTLLAILGWYQKISWIKGRPTCRFFPTCSEYARQAISTHGVLRGVGLSAKRLCQCHPFVPAHQRGWQFDPVPAVHSSLPQKHE